jgi:Rrf2 family protein
VQITAKSDYAMRALLTLAADGNGGLVKGEALATAQRLPLRFLENIMLQLRRAGIVVSQRGADGGYGLARPPEKITIAEVLRAIDGPLAQVRGLRPEAAEYIGAAEHLQQVWVAVRASLRGVLEAVTLADVVAGELPPAVQKLAQDPDNWQPH